MAYTVRKVSAISGVSVRTLHFYDETGLLKPAYLGGNGYRFYEEPQLLTLQQILFYRELGFELKQIKAILRRRGFQKIAALQSHRKTLEQNICRTHRLIETIDKTIKHLKGTRKMQSEEMFAGFSVAAGHDRFGENIKLGGEPMDCKISGKDTNRAMAAFEFTGHSSGPRHFHHDQDEWLYILEGYFDFDVGGKRFKAGPGECVFIPRKVKHAWGSPTGGKVIDVYQPAGKMEDFFREVGKYNGKPEIHDALSLRQMRDLFDAHGMDLCGPPVQGDFKVNDQGRIVRVA
jgi:DNA-binding transcriptional MerR regulator/quercetin dioxygenase-like cupin family protein